MSVKQPYTIVIGSGAGGLSSAVFLARAGHKVLVLEKHFRPGGCLQCFIRDGVKFDTGMHFIGSVEPGQSLHSIWSSLGIADRIPLHSLDTEAYNTIHLHNSIFHSARGREAWIETLNRNFPGNSDYLAKYFDAVEAVAASSSLIDHRQSDDDLKNLLKFQTVSINSVIDEIIPDPLLREVLVGELPLHAPLKDITPFAQHAFITDFYNKSAYRIIGGSDAIASELIERLRELGGDIRTGSEVTSVITDGSTVKGVEVNGESFIPCDFVVADIHPTILTDIVKGGGLRPAFKHRVKSLPNTVGSFCLYLKFKPGAVKYSNSNHFVYSPGISPWEAEDYTKDNWPRGYLYMHQADERPLSTGFASSAVVISFMHSEETAAWKDWPVGKRPEEYYDFKKSKEKVLLDRLVSDFPELKGNIMTCHSSTPATFESYTGTPGGSLYGIRRDINLGAAGRIAYRTSIPNLFLTGQNINSHGILGVSIGAFMTVAQIEGLQKMLDILSSPFPCLK